MTYPFGSCETQPFIDVQNITIRNLESHGGFLPPGVIRCNQTNACYDINFENVNITGWWEAMNWGFITEFAHGTAVNTYPDPQLGAPSERVFELFTVKHMIQFLEQCNVVYVNNENDITAWEVLIGFVIWGLQMAI